VKKSNRERERMRKRRVRGGKGERDTVRGERGLKKEREKSIDKGGIERGENFRAFT
jgi:hypothetical protein